MSAKTGFKVWAPTATKVELVTYQSDDVNAEVDKTIDMASEDKGVWSALVKNLASGTAYSYKLTFADGTVNVFNASNQEKPTEPGDGSQTGIGGPSVPNQE